MGLRREPPRQSSISSFNQTSAPAFATRVRGCKHFCADLCCNCNCNCNQEHRKPARGHPTGALPKGEFACAHKRYSVRTHIPDQRTSGWAVHAVGVAERDHGTAHVRRRMRGGCDVAVVGVGERWGVGVFVDEEVVVGLHGRPPAAGAIFT